MEELDLQQPQAEEPMTAAPKPRWSKKKIAILAAVVVAVAAIIITVSVMQATVFDRLVSQMLHKYPYADNSRDPHDSYMKIDTNPYDKDVDDLTLVELATFENLQKDSLSGIRFCNEKLGFSAAVYEKMLNTTALMGLQSQETGKYRVSWSYHPNKGLEVMYEKK